MSSSIYEIDGNPIVDEKARTKISDIKNVAKSGSYKDLDLTGATINTNYNLPNSNDSILGGVKIGENLSVTNRGVLSAPIIDESLHKTTIQLTKDRKQIININDGDTIILPNVSGEELLTIDVEIHIPWNSEHKSPSVTFPTDIKWVESPRLKFDSWYNYRFIYVKDQWLGGFTEFDVIYDSSMNMFVFDTTKTPGDLTVTLDTDRRGDTTSYDGVTDWGDGNINTNTTHTYNNDGIYLVKTKYSMITNGEWFKNKTKSKLIDCLNINLNITNLNAFFAGCVNLIEFTDSSKFIRKNIISIANMFSQCYNLKTLDSKNWDTSNITNFGNNSVSAYSGAFRACEKLTALDVSNWDTSKATIMNEIFSGCSNLTTLDVSNWNTTKVSNMSGIFSGCSGLTTLDVSNWNTSNVTSMSSMFSGCNKLTTLDVSNFDTSNVTNMSSMFQSCNKLTTLDVSNFNTTKVNNMSGIFSGCKSLSTLNISNFDTTNVTNMSGMFYDCNNLTTLDVSKFDTTNVTNMSGMFRECNKLTTLDVSNFNTSNVTSINWMFSNCNNLTTLDVSNWNTDVLTSIGHNSYQYSGLFYNCNKLVEIKGINNWNTSNISNFGATFKNCYSLVNLDLSGWNTTKATNMDAMFNGCSGLTTLDLSNFDTTNVTNVSGMFYNCTSLHQSGLTMTNCNEATKTKINSMVKA